MTRKRVKVSLVVEYDLIELASILGVSQLHLCKKGVMELWENGTLQGYLETDEYMLDQIRTFGLVELKEVERK